MKNLRFAYPILAMMTIAFVFPVMVVAQEATSKLVDTDWLANKLSTVDLRIVDVRDNVASYWLEHIPGAVYLSPDAIRWPDQGIPVKLMPIKDLANLLGRLGINNKTMVVIYSEKGDYKAPYLLWALDYIGHTKSAILDGGWTKWKSENRPTSQDYPKITTTSYISKVDKNVRAELNEVSSAVSNNSAIIIDVRPAELYSGEKGNWKRKGHIKGSINHFWGLDLNDDGTWKSKDELKKIYEEIGVTPDKNIIVSCGQGQMSAHSYFTLKHILGYPNVRNYDGGFNEWSNDESLPVSAGTNP
ncbi:MAG: sulfurtransferase [Candidatus Poribacteria bacterium]